jgi:O-antigen/teichoic acid export membrane protein
MSLARRNIVANLVGGIWITALTLAITPLQVRLLGIEAYGLIGFIATLQIVFTMFDFGLSSTVTREIASDSSPGQRNSNHLLQTASTIYWVFAAVIGAALAAASGFISGHWFKTSTLELETVEHGLYAITLYLAARWPVALYSGVLSGLQRMDILNIVKIATTSLRQVGGIIILFVKPDLTTFLSWIALNAIIEVATFIVACRIAGGNLSLRLGFSTSALKAVWSFSLSMSAISILAMLLSQFDRLLLSAMLPLDAFGYYMVAYNTAAVVSLFISAVSSTMLPSFAAAYSQGGSEVLGRRYLRANQVLLCILGLAVFPLVFFGDVVLSVWLGEAASSGASRPLVFLVLGFWLSGVLSNAYSVAIATGHPSLPLRLSAYSALPYALGLYLLVRWWGNDGAALAWMLLNLAYVFFLVPVVHGKLLPVTTRRWFLATLLPFALLGLASFGLPRLFIEQFPSTTTAGILTALFAGTLIYCGCAYALLGRELQKQLASSVGFGQPRVAPHATSFHPKPREDP